MHAAVEAWSTGGVVGFNVEHPAERAPSVTTILLHGSDPAAVRTLCHEQCNVILGHGVGFNIVAITAHADRQIVEQTYVHDSPGLCVSATGGPAHFAARNNRGGTAPITGNNLQDMSGSLGFEIR